MRVEGGIGDEAAAAPPLHSRSERRTSRLSFKCLRCDTKNLHAVNPHAFNYGTVFAKCRGCGVTHKIIDNLKVSSESGHVLGLGICISLAMCDAAESVRTRTYVYTELQYYQADAWFLSYCIKYIYCGPRALLKYCTPDPSALRRHRRPRCFFLLDADLPRAFGANLHPAAATVSLWAHARFAAGGGGGGPPGGPRLTLSKFYSAGAFRAKLNLTPAGARPRGLPCRP